MSQQPPPLEGIQHDLLSRGLPAAYVTRVVEELDEHQRDIAAEATAVADDSEHTARIGSREALVCEVVSKYQNRSFAGRHPLATFVLAPVPALVLVWALGSLVFLAAGKLLPLGQLSLESAMFAMTSVDAFVTLVAPAFVVWWFCRLAKRSARGIGWSMAATVVIALVAFLMHTRIEPPTNGPNTGTYMVGLGFGLKQLGYTFGLQQWAQSMVPVSVATLTCIRYRTLVDCAAPHIMYLCRWRR